MIDYILLVFMIHVYVLVLFLKSQDPVERIARCSNPPSYLQTHHLRGLVVSLRTSNRPLQGPIAPSLIYQTGKKSGYEKKVEGSEMVIERLNME